jgi:hypothetical protein
MDLYLAEMLEVHMIGFVYFEIPMQKVWETTKHRIANIRELGTHSINV